jgi:N-methylhydantoinase A
LGGDNATITDARVVLGHLNNKALLGGRLAIDASLSEKAVSELAKLIGADVLETARGIISISNSNIIKETKNVTVAKGYNPSDFSLVAFGGSGPMHAGELINELKIKKAIIPHMPGLLAAYGLLTENMRRDFIQTNVMELGSDMEQVMKDQFGVLEKNAVAWFDGERIPQEMRSFDYFLDMRYKGQNHEIRVKIEPCVIASSNAIRDRFIKVYTHLYAYSSSDIVQIVNFGLSAIGDIVRPKAAKGESGGKDASSARIGSRMVKESDGSTLEYTLFDRDKLMSGNLISGPAIIEQMDSTTIILPNQQATVDAYLNMILERKPEREK